MTETDRTRAGKGVRKYHLFDEEVVVESVEWLTQLAKQMKEDIKSRAAPISEKLTVREFLSKFGCQRRTKGIVTMIRNHLEKTELLTDPDFNGVWIGSEIAIELESSSNSDLLGTEPDDATCRIDMLDAAHNNPLRVKPDDPVTKAITIMTISDFSQLPVMATERRVEGVISWKSIGSQRALGQEPQWVRECMEDAQIIGTDTPLVASIGRIVDYGYVLVDRNVHSCTDVS